MFSLGNRLRSFGKRFGTIKEFAKALEMDPRNLQKYLNDQSSPGVPLLIKLENLGCDISWLLTGKKKYWGKFDSGIEYRVEIIINQLRKKYSITDEELETNFIEDDTEDYYISFEWGRKDVISIIRNWEKHHSLNPYHLMKISLYAEVSLSGLLTGSDSEYENYLRGLFLSYPEIGILLKLKSNPQLFQKVKEYVESNLNKDRIENDRDNSSGLL